MHKFIVWIWLFFVALAAAPAHAQQLTHRLYPGDTAPGSQAWRFAESQQDSPRGLMVYNVRNPEISAYLPDPSRANGAAVIVLPGGAMRVLSISQETQDIITRFNERGVAVFVLKYRIIQSDPSATRQRLQGPVANGPPPSFLRRFEIRNANANPAPNDEELAAVVRLAASDAQAAIRFVRAHAQEWRIDPNRIGMIGSSAGGGVAIGALLAGAPDAAPNFLISLYGPALQDVAVPADAPPIFLATETAHGPVTDGLLALYALWREAGKPVELHLYDVPNFQMPAALWIERAFEWMAAHQFLAAPQH